MTDGDFRKTVAADPNITAQLTAPELADVLDLEHALRHVDTIIDRALEG
jgi:adenylosuccinate lyase